MINCTTCGIRMKNVILMKCAHLFCKECIDSSMKVRNRACPICKTKFDFTDIK